ncbi:phage portal protein [Sphingosinicella sp. BN140058]|nr:phage portal protein [Sphingosinicella sp. BN140058]
MERKGSTWTLDGRVSASDRDNFVTNRVTVAEHNDAGATTAASALGLSAVWACVNLIAGTIGTLPIMIYRSVPGGVEEEEWDHPLYRLLSESPNADQTPVDFFEFAAASVELHGNAYSEIETGAGGRIVALDVPVAPELMTVRRTSNGSLEYEWTDGGKRRVVPQDRMLHVRGFGGGPLGGLSTLAFGRRTFGMAQSIELAASATFRNGIRASGVLSMAEVLTPEQRNEAERLLQEKYRGTMNAGVPMLLDRGVTWQQLTISPEDAQMLESRGWSVEEICRFFGTPPHMIGHTAGNTHLGSSIEQQTLGFVIFALRRRLKRFEQSIWKQLLTPADRARGLKVKFDLRGLMRGDSKARAEFYQLALQNGWMTINEVRALEGLPPVEGGEIIRLQMQNVPIATLMGHNGGPPLGDV